MELTHAGPLAVIGLIMLATQVAQRIGYRYLLLDGPACWLLAGLLLGPHLPGLFEETVSEAFGDEHPAHGAFVVGGTLGLFAASGAFAWLLSSALSSYVLTPVEPVGEVPRQRRDQWQGWWQDLLLVLPNAGVRFGLMLLVTWLMLPMERRLGPVHLMLALLLTPGSARHVIKLDLAYLLTAIELRGSSGLPEVPRAVVGGRRWSPGGQGSSTARASAEVRFVHPHEQAHRRLVAVRQALAEVRTSWLLLVAPALLLIEHNLVVGQTRIGEVHRQLGRLMPHLLLLFVASGAWLLTRRVRHTSGSLLGGSLDRFERASADDIPLYVAAALSLGLVSLLVLLEPANLRHTWWFVPLSIAPIIATLAREADLRDGVASGLRALAGLTAPVFFYVLGSEVAGRLDAVPWWPVAIYCAVLLVSPVAAEPLVNLALDGVVWLGERIEGWRPREGADDKPMARRLRRLGRFLANLHREPGKEIERDLGSATALRQLLPLAFSDISLTILGLAFLGGLISVEVAGVFVLAFVAGDLASTLVFGGRFFAMAFEGFGPHEVAVLTTEDALRADEAAGRGVSEDQGLPRRRGGGLSR